MAGERLGMCELAFTGVTVSENSFILLKAIV
jgi:hypothetical protein